MASALRVRMTDLGLNKGTTSFTTPYHQNATPWLVSGFLDPDEYALLIIRNVKFFIVQSFNKDIVNQCIVT